MNNVIRYQDLSLNDLSLRAQYYTLFLSGSINQAKQLVLDNPQLQGKVLSELNLSMLVDSILNLENLYDVNATQVLEDGLADYQITINDLLYIGDYSNLVEYDINNFLIYDSKLYYCKLTSPIGTLPTNTTYWVEIGLKGEVGNQTLEVNYMGTWSSVTTYSSKSLVVYNNELYVSYNIGGNLNKNPSTETTYWLKALTIIPTKMIASVTEPIDLNVGDIWIQLTEIV
jgi:hypothetical protein